MEREVDVLLVGGGVASVRCARTLRRSGFDGSILLVGDEGALPYNRPPLSKELLRDDVDDELLAAEPASWYARRNVELLRGVAVTGLDLAKRMASLGDGSRIRFGRCLLAIGAEPIRPALPGAGSALTLRTVDDARRLRAAAVSAGRDARAAIVGGGFIGVEVASALAALGMRPTILERSGELWGGSLGSELSAWGTARLEAAGAAVRTGSTVTAFGTEGVSVGDEMVDAAFSVVGIGVTPRTGLAVAAGLEVDRGVVADAGQRTSHPAVWAAGDVARTAGARVEHWHAARESGERAARSMLGLSVPPIPVPWFFSEVAGTPLDVVGSALDWDEERWIADGAEGSVLAYLLDARVVQLAIIGSALEASVARDLVDAGATADEVAAALPGGGHRAVPPVLS